MELPTEVLIQMKRELRKREDMVQQILEDAHDNFRCTLGDLLIRLNRIPMQGYELPWLEI
jgi:hypothetical protein